MLHTQKVEASYSYVTMCAWVSLCLCVCLSVCCVSLSLWMYVCVCFVWSVYVCFSLCVFVCVCVFHANPAILQISGCFSNLSAGSIFTGTSMRHRQAQICISQPNRNYSARFRAIGLSLTSHHYQLANHFSELERQDRWWWLTCDSVSWVCCS